MPHQHMPHDDSTRKRTTRAALAAAFAAALIIAGSMGVAFAGDDEEEDNLPDIQFFRGVLNQLGLRKDGGEIDYRERSPLVVPPTRDLPPPESAAVTDKNPAWPVDQEVKWQKQRAAAKKKTQRVTGDRVIEEGRPLRPDELNASGGSRTPSDHPTGTGVAHDDAGKPMAPSELGDKGFLSKLTGMFKKDSEQSVTFTREPPRVSLTEPPAGYRTPSPSQPYGVGKTTQVAKPQDYLTTHVEPQK